MIYGCDRKWQKPKSADEIIAKLQEGCRFLYDNQMKKIGGEHNGEIYRIYRRGISKRGNLVAFSEWIAEESEGRDIGQMFEANEDKVVSFIEAAEILKHTWHLYYYDESC